LQTAHFAAATFLLKRGYLMPHLPNEDFLIFHPQKEIYLDYSATTPVEPEVLRVFCDATLHFPANPNSSHHLGQEAKALIDSASNSILSILGAEDAEIIYTSGATEANNLAIKGTAFKKSTHGKHLITTAFEHPSVTACFGYLQNHGFEVDLVDTDPSGRVDISSLRNLLREDTILVSVALVNSEIGIVQPLAEIGKLLKEYPYVTFHSDVTQAVGKMLFSLENVDLASFSAHKFYGLKGIGGLIRKKDVILETQMHGGRSTTDFRSGTPALGLIVSMDTALRMAYERNDNQYRHVFGLNSYLRERISTIPNVLINSDSQCLPHIFNLSVLTSDANSLQKKLDNAGIIVSTQTACQSGTGRSETVFRLFKEEIRAKSSIRVSLSHLTTKDDIDRLIQTIEEEKP